MDVFDLRDRDSRIRELVERGLGDEGAPWPEPLVRLNPAFEPGESLDELSRKALSTPSAGASSVLPEIRSASRAAERNLDEHGIPYL